MRAALPFALGLALVLGAAGSARAQEPPPADDMGTLLPRFGIVPTAGLGVAKVTSSSPFPGFIGLTTLGAEVHVELPPFGGLFRFQYHSSGLDGRWTAPSFALGGSYRLFGDGVEHVGLLARGGLLWERWHAISENSGCPIDLFVPTNCKALQPPSPSGVISNQPPVIEQTSDTLGLFAGLRAEVPVRFLYLAGDFELSGVGNVSSSLPGTVLAARIALVLGFRDLRQSERKGEPTPRQQKRLN